MMIRQVVLLLSIAAALACATTVGEDGLVHDNRKADYIAEHIVVDNEAEYVIGIQVQITLRANPAANITNQVILLPLQSFNIYDGMALENQTTHALGYNNTGPFVSYYTASLWLYNYFTYDQDGINNQVSFDVGFANDLYTLSVQCTVGAGVTSLGVSYSSNLHVETTFVRAFIPSLMCSPGNILYVLEMDALPVLPPATTAPITTPPPRYDHRLPLLGTIILISAVSAALLCGVVFAVLYFTFLRRITVYSTVNRENHRGFTVQEFLRKFTVC